jgi:hypothetical protein
VLFAWHCALISGSRRATQVYDAVVLANGSIICVDSGATPIPGRDFGEFCKYDGDQVFFGEAAHRFSCNISSAFPEYYVFTAVSGPHVQTVQWPFIGEYAVPAASTGIPALSTRVVEFREIDDDYAPGIEQVPDFTYTVCEQTAQRCQIRPADVCTDPW